MQEQEEEIASYTQYEAEHIDDLVSLCASI